MQIQTNNSFNVESGGNLEGLQGSFSSLNYPDDYINYLNCTWIITVPEGLRINLTFSAFNIEEDYDTVTIYEDDEEVAQFTDDGIPEPFMSNTSTIRVVFETDESIVESGFFANYQIGKNETFICRAIF